MVVSEILDTNMTFARTKRQKRPTPAHELCGKICYCPVGPARHLDAPGQKILPLNCLAITLTAGVISKEEKMPSPVGERQFGSDFRRQFGRG